MAFSLLCFEAVEGGGVEGLDVGGLAGDILLGHGYIDNGAFLEELGGLGGIADDEQGHHNLAGHVVETAREEVDGVLIVKGLDGFEGFLVNGDEGLDAVKEFLKGQASRWAERSVLQA